MTLETTTELTPNQGMICEMGKEGDTKVLWDRTRPEEIEAARAIFDKLKAKGYSAYSVHKNDGGKDEVVHSFDPKAERLIMAPALIGG